jgi:DNA-binding MarR family transcriptional regulator
LIDRQDCATDGRGADVVLSPEGARAFRRATAPHLRSIKRHFADALSTEQFGALNDILDTLGRHLSR